MKRLGGMGAASLGNGGDGLLPTILGDPGDIFELLLDLSHFILVPGKALRLNRGLEENQSGGHEAYEVF